MMAFFDLPWVPLFVGAASFCILCLVGLRLGRGFLTLIFTLINEYRPRNITASYPCVYLGSC